MLLLQEVAASLPGCRGRRAGAGADEALQLLHRDRRRIPHGLEVNDHLRNPFCGERERHRT
eukprot:COSAG06_NODE_32654_length_502_cov_1.632754_2_plen_60_part_01